MKDNKNFLNKIEQLKPKIPEDLETEKQLLPRLKFMALLLLGFSLLSFGYAALESSTSLFNNDGYDTPAEMESTAGLGFTELDLLDMEQLEKFSPYVAAVAFALVGLSCLLYYQRKRHLLLNNGSYEETKKTDPHS